MARVRAPRSLDGWFFQYDLHVIFAHTTMSLDCIKPISNLLRKSELIFEIRIDSAGEGAEEVSSAER